MSSPVDPSSSEPRSDEPAERHSASGAAPESAHEPSSAAAQEERRAARIRIGTQRYGTSVPKAVARPVLATPSAEKLSVSESETARDEQGDVSTIAAQSAAPEAAAPAQSSRTEQPSKKKQPPPRVLNDQPPRHYPPPNIRDRLSPELEMEYLEALGGQSIDDIIAPEPGAAVVAELEPESRHQGRVISIHRDDVFVEIGGRQQGILQLKNFAEPPEPGATVDVVVARFLPAEGIYELIRPGAAIDVGDWSDVAEGMVVEARVTGHNKGGLECDVNRLRGFIPASQVSMYRVENLEQFVGQAFMCVITEANPAKRNLVLSHRAVMEREKAEAKEKLLAELEPGQLREGTVRSLQDFGAFVDLGGIDGLVHISQISWDRIKHPSEVLEVGQQVKVKIQKIDPQTGKIGLVLRDLSENPWANASRDFPVRTRVTGKVTRLTDFGAFVRLGPGVEGLIHISELAHKRVFRVSDVVSEGQEVDVQVLSVDPEAQRISLSLKALEAKPAPAKVEEASEEPETPAAPPKPRKVPLKGGIGGPGTGEKFGLKW
ncbi:MAG: S1 RNA-binding domain-containing protein [Pirellulales bacterium]